MPRKLVLRIVLAISFMAISLLCRAAELQAGSKGSTTTLTGIVSDSMCGAHHMAKDKTAAKCTRECVKSGSDYALVVGKKVYVLKGDKAEIDKFAGEPVTVKGSLTGDSVTVKSITSAKKQLRSGISCLGSRGPGFIKSHLTPFHNTGFRLVVGGAPVRFMRFAL